jgi:hypothetical protein
MKAQKSTSLPNGIKKSPNDWSAPTDPVLSEKELSHIIHTLSMEIREEFPELAKFLGDIPITVTMEDRPERKLEKLADYCVSLQSLKDESGPTYLE